MPGASDNPSPLKVSGVIFSGPRKYGDFSWMMIQEEYQNALFVFNDNEQQYKAHRDDPASIEGCMAGGGNAIIRPYQCEAKPRAAGIPTGPNYHSLTPEVKQIVDEAIAAIRDIVLKNGYNQIFYSANAEGKLGTHIFAPGDDVKTYILQQLKSLE